MSALQITIGAAGATNWPLVIVTALVPAAVGAGAALLGVWLTARNAERQNRRAEAALERKMSHDRGLSALVLADHLESYLVHLNAVITSWSHVDWVEPNKPTSQTGDVPVYFRPLPDWPDLVKWEHLPLATSVAATNFKRHTEFIRSSLGAEANFNDREDQHLAEADTAADLVPQVLAMAVQVRAENGVGALVTPKGWKLGDAARLHKAERRKVKARIQARRRNRDSSKAV